MNDILELIDKIIKNKIQINNHSIPLFEKDNYIFNVIGHGTVNNRLFVLIESHTKSQTDVNRFVFYRSDSEVGMWRACLRRFDGVLIKGEYDYVTQTLIDIELQNYINQHYKKTDAYPELIIKCINDPDKGNNLSALIKTMHDKNRIHQDLIFDTLKQCKAGICFEQTISIKQFVEELDKGSILDKELRSYINTNIDKNDVLNNIQTIYNAISMFMENHFILDPQKPIFIGTNTISYNTATFNMKYYKTKIINKDTKQEYILIYAIYVYNKIHTPALNGTYYTIINIIPIDDIITKFGMHSKFVTAGVYIYKILEYEEQCKLKDDARQIKMWSGKEIKCYMFIGDTMTNVWPLNKIKSIL